MKISPNRFLTTSLESAPWGAGVTRILAAAIQSVDPSEALFRCVQRQGDLLTIRSAPVNSPARTYDLRDFKHIYVVGAGKAGAPMTQAVAQILKNRLSGGLIIVKDGYTTGVKTQSSPGKIEIVQASHPIPDERGLPSSRAEFVFHYRCYELLEGNVKIIAVRISQNAGCYVFFPLQFVKGITENTLDRLAEMLELEFLV